MQAAATSPRSPQPLRYHGARRERGAVLVVGLILLLVLTLAGVVLARMQTVEERMARNEDNHQLALQAAEAALRAAEVGLNTGVYGSFASGNGIYVLVPAAGSQADADVGNWSAPAFPTLSYTAAPLNAPALPIVSRQPQYVIEALPPVAVPGCPLNPSTYGGISACANLFRITAHGWGGDSSATATVQSVFR